MTTTLIVSGITNADQEKLKEITTQHHAELALAGARAIITNHPDLGERELTLLAGKLVLGGYRVVAGD